MISSFNARRAVQALLRPQSQGFQIHVSTVLGLSALLFAGCQLPSSVTPIGTPDAHAASVAPAPLVISKLTASVNSSTVGRIIDKDPTSPWGSQTAVNPSVTFELGALSLLSTMQIKVSPVGTYQVQVSKDGVSYTTVLSNQKSSSYNPETKTFPANTIGKFVRLLFANAGKQVMVFEVSLTGSPAPVAAEPGPTAMVATASHSNASFGAPRAVDGNTNTEWGSGQVSNPSLKIDLGSVKSIAGFKIKAAPGKGTFNVLTSEDGVSFTAVATGLKTSSWEMETKSFPSVRQARYLRMDFVNGGVGVSVFEVAPILSSAPAPTPTATPTVAPSPVPTATSTPAPAPTPVTGAAIIVNPGKFLHKATSHVIGTNRNHVASDFKNGPAKLQKMLELSPSWGEKKMLYRIGHGPTDGRTESYYSYMTGFHFEKAFGPNSSYPFGLQSYPYDDLRNSLNDAVVMNADQIHVVNFGTSTPEEAGRYVSYLNKTGDANRAKYPFPKQNVKLFELGNEISWDHVRGHAEFAPNESAYATRAKLFSQQMRANSDIPIQIGAVLSANSSMTGNGWSGFETSVKNILTIMGKDVDFLTYHGYSMWPITIQVNQEGYTNVGLYDRLMTYLAQIEWSRQLIRDKIKPAMKQYAPGRDVYLANTEFFSNLYGDVKRSRGMFGALFSAQTTIEAMNEDIRTAVNFCFSHKELGDSLFFINDDPNQITAIFKYQRMLARHWGDQIVETTGQGIPAKLVQGQADRGRGGFYTVNMPKLHHAAALSADGRKLFVQVANVMHNEDIVSSVALPSQPAAVTAYELSGPMGWDSDNAVEKTYQGVSLKNYTFKKSSVTIFEIAL